MHQTNFMQNASPDPSNSGMPTASEWYRLYFSALVESNRDKALLQIERAQEAIQYRRRELGDAPIDNLREVQELGQASTYLGILLRSVGTEGEHVLWD
jgi:hypothetical protein